MGQSWAVQADGGYATEPELTQLVRIAAQSAQGMAQLANPPDESELGKGKGDTVEYLFVKNVSSQGGALSESSPIPKTKLTLVKGSFTISEYGNSLEWTGKLEDLARIDINHPFMRALMNDLQKLENDAIYTEAIKTNYRLIVNHATNQTVTIQTNGSFSGASLADPGWKALMRIAGAAENLNLPYYDGESYVYVTGAQAVTNLRIDSDVTNLLKEDSARAALNGEVGRVSGCRIVLDTHKIKASSGSSSGFNEGLLFGADSVQQQVGLPWEVRRQVGDFGRDIGVAYYGIMGWKKMLDMTNHGEEHIIFVGST